MTSAAGRLLACLLALAPLARGLIMRAPLVRRLAAHRHLHLHLRRSGRVERDAQRRPLCGPGRADGAQVVIAPSMERIAPVM